MTRKLILTSVVMLAFITLGPYYVSAQVLTLRGEIKVKNPDGTMVPVPDAVVEAFRTDVTQGKLPDVRTNSRGEFVIPGVSAQHVYALAVSGVGIGPRVQMNIKGGMDGLVIVVDSGNGRRLSEAEVRELVGSAPKTEEELKKAQAEYAAKVKEVEERNKKAQQATEIINAALKSGNEAFRAQNYDIAVAKYNEGIQADPEFVGSAPVLYKNKGVTLTRIGVEAYNAGVKEADASAKTAAHDKARKAFVDAAESFLNGWNVIKNAPAADITDRAQYEAMKTDVLAAATETFRLAAFTEKVDDRTMEIAKILMPEYLALEKDAAKKAQASVTIADLYRIREDRENAVAAYKKVLEAAPDNVDALGYLGIMLVDMGWLKNNDSALMQEGANYLQRFVAAAPDTHKLKEGAAGYLEILKTQNVVPTKTPPRRRP